MVTEVLPQRKGDEVIIRMQITSISHGICNSLNITQNESAECQKSCPRQTAVYDQIDPFDTPQPLF